MYFQPLLFCNYFKGKWKKVKPKEGAVSRGVKEYYDGDMRDKKWSDKIFRQAVGVGYRALNDFLNPETNEIEVPVGEPLVPFGFFQYNIRILILRFC